MNIILVAFLFSVLLGFIDFLSETILVRKIKANSQLISFVAGIAITYIFIHLLPDLYAVAYVNDYTLFFVILMSFVFVYLIEKVLHSYFKKKKLENAHKNFHIIYFFIYKFIIGILIVFVINLGFKELLLFFIPVSLYVLVEVLPQEFRFNSKLSNILYSLAPILGTFWGFYTRINDTLYGILTAFLVGTLLYFVIKETVPDKDKGHPFYFLLGIFLFLITIIILEAI